MSKRVITKDETISAISLFFSKKGKKLTNLTKANKNKLNEIIKQYDINIDEMICELRELEIENKKRKEQEEIERNKRFEEYCKKKEEEKLQKNIIWNSLNVKNREKVKQIYYDRYVKNIIEENESNKKICDIQEKKFRDEGVKMIERVNENTLKVRGVNVIYGYICEIQSKEDFELNYEEEDIMMDKANYELAVKLLEEQKKKKRLVIECPECLSVKALKGFHIEENMCNECFEKK